jgi:hypothetical protein
MSVFFPAGTFYEDFDMNFDVKDDIYIFMMRRPLFTPVLQLLDSKYTDSQKEKVFIADISKSGRMGYNTTI